MNIESIQKHIGQSVYVGTPYRGVYIGTLECVRPGEDGKPWRGDVRVTGIVSPPPLTTHDDAGLPVEKTTGYGIGDVIDAAAIFVTAPLPPDVTPELCHSSLAEALRRDLVRWKTLLLDTSGTPERMDTPGLTRAERIQACIDRRVSQLAEAVGDEPRAVRFGRAIKSAESKSQIKRLSVMAWDDDVAVVVEPTREVKGGEVAPVVEVEVVRHPDMADVAPAPDLTPEPLPTVKATPPVVAKTAAKAQQKKAEKPKPVQSTLF